LIYNEWGPHVGAFEVEGVGTWAGNKQASRPESRLAAKSGGPTMKVPINN